MDGDRLCCPLSTTFGAHVMTDGLGTCVEYEEFCDAKVEFDNDKFNGVSWESKLEYLGGEPRSRINWLACISIAWWAAAYWSTVSWSDLAPFKYIGNSGSALEICLKNKTKTFET